MKEKVVLGISGGVDSSVAAALLQKQGYEVIGLTIKTVSVPDEAFVPAVDGREVCNALGIKHIVLDVSEKFKKSVIDYFAQSYMDGETPNPCVMCNREVKFDSLLMCADQIGAQHIATGHYAKTHFNELTGRYSLMRSKAGKKDQTYMLYNLKQEQLSRFITPLSEYDKPTVRAMAADMGLMTSDKPDSQENCFIPPDINYVDYIRKNYNYTPVPGNFIDTKNNVIGTHKGIIYYTIGQRKGLGQSFGEPVFVLNINPADNTVTLGKKGEEFMQSATIGKTNFTAITEPDSAIEVYAKVRYAAPPSKAVLEPLGGGLYRVTFDEPQRAVTKGQSIVFYDEELLLGGGIIQD